MLRFWVLVSAVVVSGFISAARGDAPEIYLLKLICLLLSVIFLFGSHKEK